MPLHACKHSQFVRFAYDAALPKELFVVVQRAWEAEEARQGSRHASGGAPPRLLFQGLPARALGSNLARAPLDARVLPSKQQHCVCVCV